MRAGGGGWRCGARGKDWVGLGRKTIKKPVRGVGMFYVCCVLPVRGYCVQYARDMCSGCCASLFTHRNPRARRDRKGLAYIACED